MLNITNNSIYICSNNAQVEFAKIYLSYYSSRVSYGVAVTDVGLINKTNSLAVDVDATNAAVKNMLISYEAIAAAEAVKLKTMNTSLIISDVSALPCLIAEKVGVKLVEIGNFTWTDQYISIGADVDIINKFKQIYSKCDSFIAYDLSLPFAGACQDNVFKSNYIVSRPIFSQRVNEIKQQFTKKYTEKTGMKNPSFLYLSLGKSAQLPTVTISNFSGVVFYTQGIDFDIKIYPDILFVRLPNEVRDSQSYVAASDLVIAKAGWSTAAEGLVAHSKMLLIERPLVDDDTNTINQLKLRKLAYSLSVQEVVNLDYEKMLATADKYIDKNKLNKIKNDTSIVCKHILSNL